MWFEAMTGFPETSPDDVRARLTVQGDVLMSTVNGRSWGCGTLTLPSLGELRAALASGPPAEGRPRLRQIVGDVRALHADPTNAGALFQAASQFNLLEMTDPSVHPEEGVGIYEHDRTQGPTCAIACGAGTIYRNYFVPVGDRVGQSSTHQLDALADVGRALGNADGALWEMRNGYALLTERGLADTSARIPAMTDAERDRLRQALRIGLHADVEVTLPGAGHRVTQVYGAALPVAYGRPPASSWEPLARVVLEASYEATLIAAALNARRHGARPVLLTLLGGGVFGNDLSWILDAIRRALGVPGLGALDVAIVSYRTANPAVTALVDEGASR